MDNDPTRWTMTRYSMAMAKDRRSRFRLGASLFVESRANSLMNCGLPGIGLPTPNCGIDVAWINFNPVAAASSAFGSNKGRAASKERIEDDVAPCSAVEDSVSHQRNQVLPVGWKRKRVALFVGASQRVLTPG